MARARVTECSKGHPFTPENEQWHVNRNGTLWRACRTCKRQRAALSRAKRARREAATAALPPDAVLCRAGRHVLTVANSRMVEDGRVVCMECHTLDRLMLAERDRATNRSEGVSWADLAALHRCEALRPEPPRQDAPMLSPLFGMAGMLEMQTQMGGR